MSLTSSRSPKLRNSFLVILILTLAAMSIAADSRSVRSDRSDTARKAADSAVEPDAETNRRRPARVNRDASASLSGRVVEAGNSASVSGAVIIVQGRTFTADADGSFTITGLASGPTTVRIERWGYEAATRQVNLVSGSNALGTVSLAPRPVVTLTETNGTTHRLDFDSVEFASSAPLSGYVTVTPPEFCRLDGTIIEHAKTEIASIIGPGVPASAACCPAGSPGLQVTLNLKSGQSFPVILQLCEYYKYDFIGRSRDSGQWVYRDFSTIAQIQFP